MTGGRPGTHVRGKPGAAGALSATAFFPQTATAPCRRLRPPAGPCGGKAARRGAGRGRGVRASPLRVEKGKEGWGREEE